MTNSKRILIIDDDLDMCQLLSHFLQRKGFQTDTAHSGNKGLTKFNETGADLVLCDFRLGDMDGRKVLQKIKSSHPETAVIIITGYSDIKMAVDVMRHGAFDYIIKPLIPEEVIAVINKAINEPGSSIGTATTIATPIASSPKKEPALITSLPMGNSAVALDMVKQIQLVSPTNYSVLLYGESGTGKEVAANIIHKASKRKDKPFVAIDCGTLTKELAGSELFGHLKGSFTGALADKEGFFAAGEGGTLFLDEVSNLPIEVQATLLRVLQERKYKQVGSTKDMDTDVRVIVASNENLYEACKKGKFREDLYHRLNEFSIAIPPLRERKEDIPLFAGYFIKQAAADLGRVFDGFSAEVMQLFLNYDWPGNLREFSNVIRRAALLSAGGTISINTLPWEIIGNPDKVSEQTSIPGQPVLPERKLTGTDLKDAASQAEYATIIHVLQQVKFNKTKAAEALKIDRKTLYNKIKQYEESNNGRE